MEIKYINRATGNIAIEHPPGERLLKLLYDNPFGKSAILPLAKRKLISILYGKKMDSPASVSKIQGFVDSLNIDMEESIKSINEFKTFNDFFYRKLKPEVRQIEDGLISPGDGKILAFEKINDVNKFFVKGREFTLKEFLASEKLANSFLNTSMIILRLAPNDYHRYHFPYEGTPSLSEQIKGMYYSVSPYALASNFTKVFCENKREICKLSTEGKGEILLIPVGATMVGSIHSTYQANHAVEKGAEMGYFAFGGSTVVLLFDAEKFKIDEDLIKNTNNKLETYVKMGEKIGTEI
jgi:phosphatidylserine decarboxylase